MEGELPDSYYFYRWQFFDNLSGRGCNQRRFDRLVTGESWEFNRPCRHNVHASTILQVGVSWVIIIDCAFWEPSLT
jgi:hypothetical protein